MAEHNLTGIRGEVIAKQYLQNNKYTILETNWRFQKAEIDIIGKKDDVIVFVEVKTRTSIEYGQPEQFVSQRKIDFLLEAAAQFMLLIKYESEVRFDIISVVINGHKGHELKHYEDAFYDTW